MKPRRARRGSGRLALLAAALALAGGCATPKPKPVDFSETPRDYTDKDYEDVYARWTRHDRALHEVDSALEVWATFKSWDFREAYIERYATIYSLSDADRNTLRQAQLEAFHHAYEFHVTAQSASYKWNDLEKANSAWRVSLVDAVGHELAPEYVKVERLPDAYESAFFPAKTPFTKTYSIRFLVPAGGDSEFAGVKSGMLTLRIASPIGRVQLTWQSG
jgi:hypothetical protein